MRTPVPEKILAVIHEIERGSDAPTTRLNVLEKWFETRPERLPAFGLWIARKAAGRKGKTKGEAGALLDEARTLLGTTMFFHSTFERIDQKATNSLCDRARAFQDCRPLLLMCRGLELHTGANGHAGDGLRLAADWAQPRNASGGTVLNRLSAGKLNELVNWMFTVEGQEDFKDSRP